MAYHDSVRLSLQGDRVEAAKYVGRARAMLWKLARSQLSSGAMQARQRHQLNNGVVIELTIDGTMSSATIFVPDETFPGGEFEDQFVVWPRDIDHPAGIDPVHPQLMLQLKDEEWVTRFYTAQIPGYAEFDGPRGTYRTQDGEVFFPDGVRHAGNVDWVGADARRVSWYGPSSRYWCDAFIQLRWQYGKKVFCLGQVMLDTDAYIAASDEQPPFDTRWIMGAAFVDDTLYVVQAFLPPDVATATTDVPARAIEITSAYPLGGDGASHYIVQMELCTYVVRRPDPANPTRFEVVPNSRAVISVGTFPSAFNPWFFNASGTAAVSWGLPLTPTIFMQNGDTIVPPTASNPIWTWRVEDGELFTANVSLPPGESRATMAVDFRGDEMVTLDMIRSNTDEPTDVYEIVCDEYRATILRETMLTPDFYNQAIDRRRIKYADLRNSLFVTSRFGVRAFFDPNQPARAEPLDTWGIEIWHKGRTAFVPTPFNVGTFPDSVANIQRLERRNIAKLAMSPLVPLYLVVAGTMNASSTTFHWFRGASSMYDRMDHPPIAIHGRYGLGGSQPVPPNILSVRFGTNPPLDFDGKATSGWGAAGEDAAMYSGAVVSAAGNNTVSYAHGVVSPTGQQLPTLTGVAGAESRYHPLWLLGAIPVNNGD